LAPGQNDSPDSALAVRPLHEKLRDDPEISFYTALALEQTGEYTEALVTFASIPLDSEPGVDAVIQRARLLEKMRDASKGAELLERVSKEKPANVRIIMALSSLYENSGQKEKALDILIKAVKEVPQNKMLIINLVMTLDSRGRQKEAMQYAKRALEIDPDYVPALNYIGYTYVEMGKNWMKQRP